MPNGSAATLSIVVQARDEATQALQQVQNALRGFGTNLQQTIRIVQQTASAMSGVVGSRSFAEAWYNSLVTGITDFERKVRARMSSLKDSFKTFFTNVWEGAKEGWRQGQQDFQRESERGTEGFGALSRSVIVLNQAWELLTKTLGLVRSAWDAAIGGLLAGAEEIDNLSKRMGLTTDQVQDLQVIAEQTGASVTGLATAMQRLTKSVGEAGNTSSTSFRLLHDSLKFTNEEIAKLNRATSLDRFIAIIDRLREFEPTATRDATAARLLGLQIGEANKVMQDFDKAMQAVDRNRESGLALTKEQIKSVTALNDVWKEFTRVLGQMRNQLAAQPELFNAITNALAAIRDASILAFRELVKIFGPEVKRVLEEAAAKLGEFVGYLQTPEGAEALRTSVSNLAGSVRQLAGEIGTIIDFASNPIGAAIVGAVLGFTVGGVPGAIVGAGTLGTVAGVSTLDAAARARKAAEEAARRAAAGEPQFTPEVPASIDTSTNAIKENTKATNENTDAKKVSRGAMEDNITSHEAEKKAIEKANEAYKFLSDTLDRFWAKNAQGVLTSKDVEFALKTLRDAQSALNSAAEKGDQQSKDRLSFVQHTIDSLEGMKEVVKAAEEEQKKLNDANEKFNESLDELTTQLNNTGNAVSEYHQKILKAAQSGQDWKRLTEDQRQTLIKFNEAIAQQEAIPKAQAVLDKLTESLAKGKATTDGLADAYRELAKALIPFIAAAAQGSTEAQAMIDKFDQQFRKLADQTKLQEEFNKTKDVGFDLFDALFTGAQKVFDALVSGTQKPSDAFKALGQSILGSLTNAFAEGFKKKLGFEEGMKLNLVGLGKELFSLIGGIFTGGGAEGGGLIGGLLGGIAKYTGLPVGGLSSLFTGGGAAAAPTGGAAAGGGGFASLLGGGVVPSLLLGLGTYLGLQGKRGGAAFFSGLSALSYGAHALFATQYGQGLAASLAQNYPNLFQVAQLFGGAQLPAGAAGLGGATGITAEGFAISPVAGEALGPGAQAAGTALQTVGTVIGVVAGLATAALGVYSAIKAESAIGKAAGATSAAAGLFAAAGAAGIIPVVGWVVAAVLAIVAALLYAFQPGPNFQAMFRESAAKTLNKVLGTDVFQVGPQKLTPRERERLEGITGGQDILLQVGARGAARALRAAFPSVGYENAVKWVTAMLDKGVAELLKSGVDIEKIIRKLIYTFQNFETTITGINIVVFDRQGKMRRSVQDYADAVGGAMVLFSERFPTTIADTLEHATDLAEEVIADFGVALPARLAREAIQKIATIGIETGEIMAEVPEPGFLRKPKLRKKLRQKKGKRKRLQAALEAETAVDEMIAQIERAIRALELAGAAAPLRQATSNINAAYAGIQSLSKLGAEVFADQFPKAMQAAEDAIKSWGDTLLQTIDLLRQAEQQILETNIKRFEEIDALEKNANTAAKYQSIIDEQINTYNRLMTEMTSYSSAARVGAILGIMDLLRAQAQAAIQDYRDRYEAEHKDEEDRIDALNDLIDAEQKLIDANQDRIDALNDELENLNKQAQLVAAMANLFDQVQAAIKQTELAGVGGSPFAQLAILQQQTVDALEKFRTTAGEERAQAGAEALAASQQLLQFASSVYGVGSAEYLTIQRQVLAYQKSLADETRRAAQEKKRLDAEIKAKEAERDRIQKENEAHLDKIEEYNKEINEISKQNQKDQKQLNADIEKVNRDLAQALSFWYAKLLPALQQQADELRAELGKFLTPEEIERALADPAFAQLIVQQLMLKELEKLRKVAIATVNAIQGKSGAALQDPIPGVTAAMGGAMTVTKPTVILAGERFRPERVIVRPMPDEGHGRAEPINFNVTINMQGGFQGTSQQFARTAADALEAEMRLRMPRILQKRVA